MWPFITDENGIHARYLCLLKWFTTYIIKPTIHLTTYSMSNPWSMCIVITTKIFVAICFPIDLGEPGPWFNIKMTSYQYRKSHCGDKTILRPSYLHNGIFFSGKMSSLYWIRAQITCVLRSWVPNGAGPHSRWGTMMVSCAMSLLSLITAMFVTMWPWANGK